MTTKTKTAQLVDSLTGMYYRQDKGLLTGRNSDATDRTLASRWNDLQAALEDGGYEELDANETLAARYARLERRHLTSARTR